jgi:hypothetical protein
VEEKEEEVEVEEVEELGTLSQALPLTLPALLLLWQV